MNRSHFIKSKQTARSRRSSYIEPVLSVTSVTQHTCVRLRSLHLRTELNWASAMCDCILCVRLRAFAPCTANGNAMEYNKSIQIQEPRLRSPFLSAGCRHCCCWLFLFIIFFRSNRFRSSVCVYAYCGTYFRIQLFVDILCSHCIYASTNWTLSSSK